MEKRIQRKKTGLVFSGGGGKGAYEIGVWKALKEFNMDSLITAVSGTSVGGLNGALFVQGDYEAGERIWKSISSDKLLTLNYKQIIEKAMIASASLVIPGLEVKVLINLIQIFESKGWFSRNGLKQLITESKVCSSLSMSNIPFHICILNGNTGELEYPEITGRPAEEIELWLLATCAIPVIFGSVDINGCRYHDAGVLPGKFSNCTPYQPLVEKHGCTHVIRVYLDRAAVLHDKREKYKNIRFWDIVPAAEFKGKISALNFDPENAEKLIENGYNDAKKILAQFYKFLNNEGQYLKAIENTENANIEFYGEISENQALRSPLNIDIPIPCSGLDRKAIKIVSDQNPSAKISGTDNSHALCNFSADLSPAVYPSQNRQHLPLKEAMHRIAAKIEKQEQNLIENGLDTIIAQSRDNSAQLLDEAFTSISVLASTEGRIKYQMDQGFFSRLKSALTGQNNKRQAELNWDLNRAIYANQCLIQKLNKKHLITMEMVVFLSNKTNYLMSHVNMLYGKTKAIENKFMEALTLMRDALISVFDEISIRIDTNALKIKNIEKRLAMEEWQERVKDAGRNVPDKNRFFLNLISNFYGQTKGNWTETDICRLRNVICETDLYDYMTAPAELFSPKIVDELFTCMDSGRIFPVSPDKKRHYPVLRGMQIALEHPELPHEKIINICESDLLLNCRCKIPYSDLAMELLHSIKSNDKKVNSGSDIKNQYISAIDTVLDAGKRFKFDDRLSRNAQALKDMIVNFKIVVPVIGKFSSGKSSLLNKYLGGSFLSYGVTPETAIATELTYGEQDKVIINYMDGHQIEKNIECLKNIPADDNINFLQLFLKNPRLFVHKNLILVDMPGFDSANDKHNKAISRYIQRGDFFINLMPSDVPFDYSIISRLHEIYSRQRRGFALFITKAGRKPVDQINNLKKEIKSLIENNLSISLVRNPGIIEVKDKKRITIKDFEDLLDEILLKEENFLVSRYHEDIILLLNKVKKRITAIQDTVCSNTTELEEKRQKIKNSFQRLEKKIESDLKEMEYKLCSEGKEKLYRSARSALNSSCGQLVQTAKNGGDMSQVVNSILRPVLQQEFQSLVNSVLADLEKNISRHTDGIASDIQVSINIPAEEKEKFSFTGGTIGVLLGFMLDPIAAVICGVLGGLFVSKFNKDGEYENNIRNAVKNKVIPEALNMVMQKVEQKLNAVADEIGSVIREDFKSEEKNYKKQFDKIQNVLSKNKQLNLQHQKDMEKISNVIQKKINELAIGEKIWESLPT